MVLIPFPRLVRSNPLSSQVKYEGKLSKALEHASRAIGVIISIAVRLAEDETAMEDTVAKVESILGRGVHHRILRNYTTLMLFATKVFYLHTMISLTTITRAGKLTFNYKNYTN